MKKLSLLSLFIVFVFSFCKNESTTPKTDQVDLNTEIPSPERFGVNLIAIISQKDYPKLVSLTLTRDQASAVISNSTWQAERKKEMSNNIETKTKEILTKSKTNFEKVIKEIEEEGILLNEIKFESCDYSLKKKNNIMNLKLSILFKFKGNSYTIKSTGVGYDNEWRFTGDLEYSNQNLNEDYSSKVEMETRAREIQDSIAEEISKSIGR